MKHCFTEVSFVGDVLFSNKVFGERKKKMPGWKLERKSNGAKSFAPWHRLCKQLFHFNNKILFSLEAPISYKLALVAIFASFEKL